MQPHCLISNNYGDTLATSLPLKGSQEPPSCVILNTRAEKCDCNVFLLPSDVADEMEYDERLAHFRQTRLNPFDRGEGEDGPQGGKTPPQHGTVLSL